jgi:hypothetical protein
MQITERYRRVDFGQMEVEITFDDPVYNTRPFSIRDWLTLDDQELERAGQHWSSPCAGGNRSKLRRDDENAVIRGIEPHIARSDWSRQVFTLIPCG